MRLPFFISGRFGRVAIVLAAGILLLAGMTWLSLAGTGERGLAVPPALPPAAVSRCPLLGTYDESVTACRRLWDEDLARSLGLRTPERRAEPEQPR